ncbi:MAG TPA: alpha/beta hydrolase [Vicinamibacterales bacterium]|nr:alpha/beta hydrolase [Vicinamibacterales bacterium]
MQIVDVGSGAPVILVPGIQGRWEWMKPAVDALSARCRVVTFSLADEPTCGGRFDAAHGFDCYVDQIREAMDLAGISKAVVAGVSYGGLIAAAFAAHHPARVSGLVLVSAIPPRWSPDTRARFYLRAPRLLSPLFILNSLRMYREIAAATPGVLQSVATSVRHGMNVLTHMMSPGRMARRVHLLGSVKLDHEMAGMNVPTLIVTGEPALDMVVPVRFTEEYTRLWPHAERVTIARTGHIGLITRPDAFAEAVAPFVERHAGVRLTRPEQSRRQPDTTQVKEQKVG